MNCVRVCAGGTIGVMRQLVTAPGLLLAALAVSFAATIYPARAATRVMPVETLRYE